MNKLSLKQLKLTSKNVLQRDHLKSIIGGNDLANDVLDCGDICTFNTSGCPNNCQCKRAKKHNEHKHCLLTLITEEG